MLRKIGTLLLMALALILSPAGKTALAQDNSSPKPPEPRKPVPAYHLEFALNELEDGKKINGRQYSTDAIAERRTDPSYIRDLGNTKRITIGSKVPVETETGKFAYIDVGTSIWYHLLEDEAELTLDAKAEVSSVVPGSGTDPRNGYAGNHVLRQLAIQSATVITLGKSTTLGTVDDPDSKRQFQLEVTVTKLK
ncbi:MAG: hypothetical protein ABSF93_12855 [Candidatus Sulfotelmatobacter sp.]|jgi:hypothetical protein